MKTARSLLALAFLVYVGPACPGGGGKGGGGGPSTPPLGELLTLAESKSCFPMELGTLWSIRGTLSDNGGAPTPIADVSQITGTKTVLGTLATVVQDTDPSSVGTPLETYLTVTDTGVTNWGNNDSTDFLTPQLVPYQEVQFPLQVGASFVSFQRTGLVWAQDLDGDGKFEQVNASSTVKVAAIESVSVMSGTFLRCVRIETTLVLTVIFSSDHTSATVVENDVEWFAPGVGPVRKTVTTTGDGGTESSSEELVAARIPSALFGAPASLAAGVGPNAVAIADLNGDGKLDLVVTNTGSGSLGYSDSSVSVFLGDGMGGFGAPIPAVAGTFPVSVAIGDFNGDGMPDLAVANYGGTSVSVLLGKGDGTFGAPADLPVTATLNPTSVVVADFNGDGKLDLAVSVAYGGNATPGHVSIFLGNGNGTFGASTDFAVGGDPNLLVVGDLNGDGTPDLVVANSLSNSISILLGDGHGSFTAAPDISLLNAAGSIAIADLNGDGKMDLVVTTNSNIANSRISIFPGLGAGAFGTPQVYSFDPIGGGYLGGLAVTDVDGDGKLDVVVGLAGGGEPWSATGVYVLRGDGAGNLSALSLFIPGVAPKVLAAGDFSGDGIPDLAGADGSVVPVLLHAAP